MSRAIPSNTLELAVRKHLGLTQAELGRYMGTSGRQISDQESGRRQASPLAYRRLEYLSQLLPPPEGTGASAPTFINTIVPVVPAPSALATALPDFGPLATIALQTRQFQVAGQAAGMRWALYRAGKAAALQHRREWGLGVLQAMRPGALLAVAEQAHFDWWLSVLAADVEAARPGPAAIAEQALMVVRLLALDVEAAALGRLLALASGAA